MRLRSLATAFLIWLPLMLAQCVGANDAHAGPLIIPVAIIAVTAFAAYAGVITVAAAILTIATVVLSVVAQMIARPASNQSTSTDSSGLSGGSSSTAKVGIDQKQDIKQSTQPRRIIYGEARVGGVYGFLTTIDNNQWLVMSLILAGHQCASVEGVFMGEELAQTDGNGLVYTSRYAGNAYFWTHVGTTPQQADGLLLARCPEFWDNTKRGDGICYLVGQLFWDNLTLPGDVGAKLWSGGIPNITAIVKGKVCYDPRWGGSAWTENAALIIADYLWDSQYGLGVAFPNGVNLTALIAAANACDELVTTAAGGTQPRYTINGSFTSDVQPDEILGRMCGAMHGKAIYDGEQWTLIAGVYEAPTFTITDDMMLSPSQIVTLTSARDSFNGVKGTYIEPSTGWNGTDFPAVISAGFTAIDGGIQRLKDIELPFTNNVGMAQRVAKIDLLRNRQEIGETFSGVLSCWQVATGDTVLRTSERYGWTNKPFEVRGVKFIIQEGDEGSGGTLGVEIALAEIDPSIFDWNTSEENTVDPAPNTNFPDVFIVGPPGPIAWAESLYVARAGGGVRAELVVSWGRSADAFVVAYRLEYRLLGAATWNIRPQTPALTDSILDIQPGTYQLRVASINWANNRSAEYSTATATVQGLSAAPETPTGLTLTTLGGFAFLRWDRALPLDVLEGGTIQIRFTTVLDAPKWVDGVTISHPLPGNDTSAAVPARAGSYMVKFYDTTGNASVDPAIVLGFQNSVLDFVGIGDALEEPDFSGARVNVDLETGPNRLILVGPPGMNIDDVGDIDSLTSFDNYSSGIPDGIYTFANSIDLGTVTRCRLTAIIESLVFAPGDLIDARTQSVDDWPVFDGVPVGEEADGYIQVRFTNDNPAGSPAWSDWQRLDAAEFSNRAFQFRLVLTRNDETVSIEITAAGVVAEELA